MREQSKKLEDTALWQLYQKRRQSGEKSDVGYICEASHAAKQKIDGL